MFAKSLIRASVLYLTFIINVIHADYLPEGTYYEEGNHKRVLNIRKAPFFAKGDGKTDDTKAFIHAYDFILNEIDKNGWIKGKPSSSTSSYIIYVPNGHYLISDTIIYSGNLRLYDLREYRRNNQVNHKFPGVSEAVVWIRIQGEDKNRTIIKLKDYANGFAEANTKPAISFGKTEFNNLTARNKISDLSIHIGKGNPGAIGLLFAGANNAFMSELNIVSEDLKGNSGVVLPIPPSMGWHNDISIEGFDYGIRLSAYHASHNSFEDIKLNNQNIAAVYLENGSASFEHLLIRSRNSAAILQNNSKSLMTISNSNLICSGACRVGINSINGQMLIKDTNIHGYELPVDTKHAKSDSTHISTMTINENSDILKTNEVLPFMIGKTPPIIFKSNNSSDWISPDTFSYDKEGNLSNANKLQLAVNSGKPIVYLPFSEYVLDSPVHIPCSVKRISGLYSTIKISKKFIGNAALIVSEECTEPLTIEEIDYAGKGTFIGHSSKRALYLRALTTQQRLYENLNSETRKELYLSNVNGWGKSKLSCINENVWARFINTESPGKYNFYLDDCHLWLLGFKTEKLNTNYILRNGSVLKILGGVVNQFDNTRKKGAMSELPLIDSSDSEFSVTLVSTGPKKKSHGFSIFAAVKNGKNNYKILWDEFSKREKAWRQIIVPLYQYKNSEN
ncbi:glycosyl hydrolase family 28-related protein [Candidatus Thiodiazotropha sp. CDECU1]|uniref:glycosyl hydrolase family 28-related protein n=1 Tax=Candidatus Thiodiazotropha sp. CDECU1 TaxID=3065865 RepID=UPI0029304D38|nr:glycosyl hydrolase family 28-related protein [Candidatus Thiodiazotropha sp. CDECU1]